MKTSVCSILLIALIVVTPMNLVYYESNVVSTSTTVEQPLEGSGCIYNVEVAHCDPYKGTVTIINHANRPVKGRLKVTLTGGYHWQECAGCCSLCQWLCRCWDVWALATKVTYRGETIPYLSINSTTKPKVTHTFSPRVYSPGENIYPIRVNCEPQVVDICWEVVQ